MTSQTDDRPLKIEVTVSASKPELLEGLDVWLDLGLITDRQVKQIGYTYLACLLPEPVVAPVPKRPVAISQPIDDWEEETPVVVPRRQSRLSQMWYSLRDELSVRWLLFLGVFLVVVSSGVLAATQWQNFPAVGQYAVLLAYTVIFWVGSFWAGKQRNLQLTAQTLQLVTLLLVPVNFWAIDSFRLWGNPVEWVVVAIAAITLSAITLLHRDVRNNSSRIPSTAILLLFLSYLHWGWQWRGFPLIAVYIGMVGTAIFLPKRFAIAQTPPQQQSSEPDASSAPPNIRLNTPIGSSIVIYALTVLLGRAIFGVRLPVEQLGLAIGICGWLFGRLGQSPETTGASTSTFQSRIWERVGATLLLIGWAVSVSETVPWQATAVSGLALWFFATRLQRFWLQIDLLAIFAIGLQAQLLLWRLVPAAWQREAIAFFTQLTNSQNEPFALLSVALFPSLIGTVLLTDWLHRASKPQLARFGEGLALCFGVVLTFISLFSPTLRSLNLLLSTITLAAVTFRWTPTRTNLVYLTHITGLLALASVIDWQFPNLSQPIWAGILLVGMVLEWGYCILPHSPLPTPHSPLWQRSAWHLGFVLSGLSYTLLWDEAYPDGILQTPITKESMLLWLLTPLTLTLVASRTDAPRRQHASWFSVAALGMAQLLTLLIPGVRLISLGFATGLMLVNTRYLRQQVAAAITVGCGLGFIGTLLWEGIPGLPRLLAADWFLVGAIAILLLWISRSLLLQRHGTLAALYAEASDNWATTLSCFELLALTLHSLIAYSGYSQGESFLLSDSPSWKYLVASCLIVVATLYRQWQQPTNEGIFSISWAVELGVAEAVILAGGSTLELATVNIILGLVTLFASDWWLARQRRPISLSSVEILPLLYAVLGIALRFGYFTSWTGLLTLGAALTGIGIGRRKEEWKPLTYLSLAGISVAWYELVIYQMLQADDGSPADAFTILAGVAVAIAYAYRLLAWFWQLRTDERLLSLSVAEIKITAHIHWAIGSLLMLAAGALAVNEVTIAPRLTGVGIAICLLLATYALLQGRQRSHPSNAYTWVYLGVTEVVATVVYARLLWTELSVLDAWFAVIACGIAGVMYELPWKRLGWPKTPWRRSSLVLPLFTIWATVGVLSDFSLLLVAGFYAWIAFRRSNIRFTYLSVFLIDWAIARWFGRLNLTDLLWYVTLYGLSLLYVAQFDPGLKQPQQREIRHYLRILGSGGICGVALVLHQDTGIIPGIMSTIAIFAGLILRVRAFLFVGTATFVLTAFYQLVVLIRKYSFAKWVVGLIVGIVFIAMAANFETRREQITSVLRNRRNELEDWE
jgi:hypothetical protein